MQETDVGFGREDPPEEGEVTHSSIPAWRIPWTEESGGATAHGVPGHQGLHFPKRGCGKGPGMDDKGKRTPVGLLCLDLGTW